jgi:hypothetical protein
MLVAASARGIEAGVADRLAWAMAPMESIPTKGQSFDLIIAHGIWNLAPSVALFRRAVEEAARVAHHETALFVFTFSRNTLPPDVPSVPGEPFIFTQFSGQPQCFLTEDQLLQEMARVGFEPDPGVQLTEYNRRGEAVTTLGGPRSFTRPPSASAGFR